MARLQLTQNKRKAEGTQKEVDEYKKSNALLTDVILNYRTIVSFGEKNIKKIIQKFESLLIEPSKRRVRNAHIAGIFFGFS